MTLPDAYANIEFSYPNQGAVAVVTTTPNTRTVTVVTTTPNTLLKITVVEGNYTAFGVKLVSTTANDSRIESATAADNWGNTPNGIEVSTYAGRVQTIRLKTVGTYTFTQAVIGRTPSTPTTGFS